MCVLVCVGGAVRPGCRYHPSPCHRPKGCWESGRQLPGSDNRDCILIFRHRMLEKPAPLLPHRPVRKTINPVVWEQSTERSLGHRWLRIISTPIMHQILSSNTSYEPCFITHSHHPGDCSINAPHIQPPHKPSSCL